ncbi:MAG: hypothetical protein ACR2RF_16065 [Geminicoccaceae bacterium]
MLHVEHRKITKACKNFVIGLCMFYSFPAFTDEIDNCIEKKQTEFEDPQNFSQKGNVTCPAGDVVGVIPRTRKHDRNGTVSYIAPDGYQIENKSITSVQVSVVSSNNGGNGSASISENGKTASVDIYCRGKPPGQGRAWHEIVLSGTIIRVPNTDALKTWVLDCVRCVGTGTCD